MVETSKIVGTNIDYAIIIIYLLGILCFGMFFSKYTKSTKEFFLAGQRFAWWLIAFSAVASLVGSYSFIKYSEATYKYGLSATQAYLDDWWWMPIWMFGWIPFIYYSRVISIPEYFGKRFNQPTRALATLLLLLYMLFYIGMNLYTLGVALHALLGWNVILASLIVATIVTIYVTAGGQTSVIMTDLLQGIILIIAGLAVFILGTIYLQDSGGLWSNLPQTHKFGMANFNKPADFNFVGIFWQDAICNSAAFWFMNQGILMRFMSAKSIKESRKAILFAVLILMPISALAVAGGGLVGRAIVATGTGAIPASVSPKDIFIIVTDLVTKPGIFGLIMAGLVSALMSTADTLINAVSAVFVNDIYRPYFVKKAEDKHYLKAARISSVGAAFIGISLVPLFMTFKTIYAAHATFTAAITPPLVSAILMGCLWKRYTTKAAFWTLLGGIIMMIISFIHPGVISPFAHGSEPGGTYFHAYTYMRALYGLVTSISIGVLVTLFTTPKPASELIGLVWGTEKEAAKKYKEQVKL